MCGICGFVGGVQKTEVLKSMMESIRHRGPDENGIFEGDGVSLGMSWRNPLNVIWSVT
ncbi:MAG: hypothetical protein SPF19_15700 [Oliverpabstia sp.]|nr:hypothetical protein [Lachnospiraceae bacterium]MDY5027939.1 hypothetical protein [Oliverpabstia sp.]